MVDIARLFVVVVVAALQNMEAFALDFIDETVLFVDGTTPSCREAAF